MDSNSQPNQTRERSIPITTTLGDMKTTLFPVSSTSHPGASAPFNSSRGSLFNQLNQFRKNQHADEMFSDRRPFSSFDRPSMSSAARNTGDFSSHDHGADEENDQGTHQPRIYNIPIQLETPHGTVPIVRASSQSPDQSQFRNMRYGDTPVGSTSSSPVPDISRQRSRPSPVPTPKPMFFPSFKPQSETSGFTMPHQYHSETHSHPEPQGRAHTIPVRLEKDQLLPKSGQPLLNYSAKQSEEFIPNFSLPGQGSPCDSTSRKDSPKPESQKSDGPHVVSISVNFGSKSQPSDQPAFCQAKPIDGLGKSTDPLDLVKVIEEETIRLEKEVIDFGGKSQDKYYRYLDEMLTQCMLKLDNIDSYGREDVRSARKNTLAHVERTIAILEKKVRKMSQCQEEDILVEKIETACSLQRPSETTSTIDFELVEDDEDQQNTNFNANETISDQLNEADNQMEVESGCSKSKDGTDDQIDKPEESETLEEDPSVIDGSSKDFYICPKVHLSNKNICRTEEVIIEEMDKEEPPEEPSKIDPEVGYGAKAYIEIDTMGQDLDSGAEFSNEPKIELPPEERTDELDNNSDSNNNSNKQNMDIEVDSIDSFESLNSDKPANRLIVILAADNESKHESGDLINVQPYIELPDENSILSSVSSKNLKK